MALVLFLHPPTLPPAFLFLEEQKEKKKFMGGLQEFLGSTAFCCVWNKDWQDKMSQLHMWGPKALHTALVGVLRLPP
jgi:hypothetical protein